MPNVCSGPHSQPTPTPFSQTPPFPWSWDCWLSFWAPSATHLWHSSQNPKESLMPNLLLQVPQTQFCQIPSNGLHKIQSDLLSLKPCHQVLLVFSEERSNTNALFPSSSPHMGEIFWDHNWRGDVFPITSLLGTCFQAFCSPSHCTMGPSSSPLVTTRSSQTIPFSRYFSLLVGSNNRSMWGWPHLS